MDVPRSFLLYTLSFSSALPLFFFFLSYFFLFFFFSKFQNFRSRFCEVGGIKIWSTVETYVLENITILHIDTDEFVTLFNL